MTSVYRLHGARCAMESAQRLGVLLMAMGGKVYVYPMAKLTKHPGLRQMLQRYEPEVMTLLDGLVE